MSTCNNKTSFFVNPDVLKWARERNQYPIDVILMGFPDFEKWETGEKKLSDHDTIERLSDFFEIGIGFFYCHEVPKYNDFCPKRLIKSNLKEISDALRKFKSHLEDLKNGE